jgi:hypothetical protein
MDARRRLGRMLRRFFRRGEAGFIMIVVLVALLMLSVLGASTLLLMVSSAKGILSMSPEQRAFQAAEAGLYVGHTKIVTNMVGTGAAINDSILGGYYYMKVEPKEVGSTTDFIVTSLGVCEKDGVTYRRKLQESVYYSGEQAFDALRNYLFFAGHNLYGNFPGQQNNYPITINGNIRAENDLRIVNYCYESTWDYLVINGSVEAGNSINLEAGGTNYYANQPYFDKTPNPLDSRGVNVMIYGDIKAGSVSNTATAGSVSLYAWSGQATLVGDTYTYVREGTSNGVTSLFAANNGSNNVYNIYTAAANNLYVSKPNPPGHDKIYQGTHQVGRSVQKVYIPEPNFEYYKALAKQQDSASDPHFFDPGISGTTTLPASIKKTGISSMSVYYSTGSMLLSNSVWADPATNALFVCEGSFSAVGEYTLKTDCRFQVIAGVDVSMGQDQSNRNQDQLDNASNVYFFYAKRDLHMCLSHFNVNNMQGTALRDVYLWCDNEFSYATFNYRAPQVDIQGWPIDVVIKDWKELPVDQ